MRWGIPVPEREGERERLETAEAQLAHETTKYSSDFCRGSSNPAADGT